MSELVLFAGLGLLFCAVMMMTIALMATSPGRRRAVELLESQVQRVNLRAETLSAPVGQRLLLPVIRRLEQTARWMTPVDAGKRLDQKLVLAGSPEGWTVWKVAACKLAMAIGGCLIGLMLVARAGVSATSLVLVIAFTWMGAIVPNLVLLGRASKRQTEIRRALPDTMDLLSITVEAGLGLEAAISVVSANVEGPLSQELNRLLHEIRLGVSKVDAFRNLAERTDVDEIQSFLMSMIQAETFGVSITKVLRAQAIELRSKRRQTAERKAQQLGVKMIFPLIFFILPSIFVVTLGPAVLSMMETLFK
jgi:tight adherence protein C